MFLFLTHTHTHQTQKSTRPIRNLSPSTPSLWSKKKTEECAVDVSWNRSRQRPRSRSKASFTLRESSRSTRTPARRPPRPSGIAPRWSYQGLRLLQCGQSFRLAIEDLVEATVDSVGVVAHRRQSHWDGGDRSRRRAAVKRLHRRCRPRSSDLYIMAEWFSCKCTWDSLEKDCLGSLCPRVYRVKN
jgi:hypothetical protein